MGNITRTQVKVIPGKPTRPSHIMKEMSFYDVDGNPITPGAKAVVVAPVATANGSDLATTQALANQLKITVNAILTALKNAGLMASS